MQFFNTVADNLLPLHTEEEEAPAATDKEDDKQGEFFDRGHRDQRRRSLNLHCLNLHFVDSDKKITRNSNRLRDRIPHKIKETYICAKVDKQRGEREREREREREHQALCRTWP